MSHFNVSAAVTLLPIPETCGYLAAPPVSFPSLAPDWNLDPTTDINGRYIEQNLGQVQGVLVPKLQDTYLTGSSGRTGRAFTAVSGTWKDDFVEPLHDVYGLLMPDSTPEIAWEVRSSSITTGIEAADLVIRRGIPPAGDTTARTQTGYNAYLELAYNATDNTGYRLAFEWGRPIRLDVTTNNGATWSPTAIARSLGILERYLAAHAGLLRLRIVPDAARGRLSVEIGDDAFLVHSRSTPDLPAPGLIRLHGYNGSISFCYFPLRSQPATVKGLIDTQQSQLNASAAFLTLNALSHPPNGQTANYSLSSDGQTFTWQAMAAAPDAGDGLGGADAPVISDVCLVVPAVWTDSVDSVPDPIGILSVPVISVDEHQRFDDASRTLTSAASVTVDNRFGAFSNAYGNRYVQISATVGGPVYPRFAGIAGAGSEGIDLSTVGPTALARLTLPCRGSEVKMQHAAAQRRIYDGWCLYSAVRFECELGNVHPQWMANVPLYIPPGGFSSAPYGPADPNCPYPVLAAGSGVRPRYDFGPDVSPWSALGTLARESASPDPVTLQPLPFYMGFDVTGQFRFEPFSADGLLPQMYYSDVDSTGQGLILGELHAYNSVAQMRSDIDFQGIDSRTGDLLMTHITMPDNVRSAIGYHYPWLERNSRFDASNIQQMAQSAAQVAGAAQQVVRFKAPFQPFVYAGQKITVSERKSLGGSGQFIILEMRSKYGMRSSNGADGHRESWSLITARRTS